MGVAMAMKINSNVSSLNAQKNLNRAEEKLGTPLQRLSSGKRINSAKDDAAGLAIVARMAAQLTGSHVAARNANDGISLAQVAEGALSEAGNMLQRIRELAVQSANATNSPSDRKALQEEVGQLTSELDRLAGSAEFNGQKILDGSFGAALFQVGANPHQTIAATSGNFQTDQYGDYQISGEGTSVGSSGRVAAAGSFDIQGAAGTATVDYQAGASAKELAASVNQVSEDTGVSASAETAVELEFSATGSYQLNIRADNGEAQTVGFTLDSATGAESLSSAVSAFNDHSGSTGVIASVNAEGTGITLRHLEGENIELSDTATSNSGDVTVSADTGSQVLAADAVADTAVATGQVSFDSDDAFTVSDATGSVTANASEASALQKVAQLDVSNVDQANEALKIVDAAMADVAAQRADYGALASRFESTVRNLENYSVNLSASRSRIEDADYAKETAELTRSLIIERAGIAMLGQANANNKLALGLLGTK